MFFPYSLCLRSTQTRATSSTVKQRGSISVSPWWTFLRSASGYQKECLRRLWKKRLKMRVRTGLIGLLLCPRSFQPIWSSTSLHSVPGVQYATLICLWSIVFLPVSTHCTWDCLFPADNTFDPPPILTPFPPAPSWNQKGSWEPVKTDDLIWSLGKYWREAVFSTTGEGPAPQKQWRERISSHTDLKLWGEGTLYST